MAENKTFVSIHGMEMPKDGLLMDRQRISGATVEEMLKRRLPDIVCCLITVLIINMLSWNTVKKEVQHLVRVIVLPEIVRWC
uniref:Uncharacterized protein n=1 Tax=Acrobeloides nanus TaxID=290746 RepID=A0A914DJV7_9BILA